MKPRGVDAPWTNSPTKLTADVQNTLTSSGSVPVKKAIPAPVVEPVVVTPGEESDETSSVEVSPVKKIKFPLSSLLSAVKEEDTKSSDAGQLNFGIKTLSQIRQKNPREAKSSQNTAIVTSVQPGDLRKIVSLKGTSSTQLEGDKLSSVVQSGVGTQKAGAAVMVNMQKRISLRTGDETPLTTMRKLITLEKEEKPTVISLYSGSDGAEKVEETSSSGIKTLAQIRQERFQKSIHLNKSRVSEQGDGGIKTLEQIRRERKARAEMKMTEQGDAPVIGSIENMESEKSCKEESGISDGDDYGIKSLDEIKKERLQKFASGDDEADVPGVKSLEQIRRERIANRLGLRTDKENTVVSATGELDSIQSTKNQTLRSSIVSRLGKDAIGSQNTIHTRVAPSVKHDNLSESGRKIQIKEGSEIQSLQSAGQVLSRKIVTVRPAVSNTQEESVVKPKKRRVFLMGAVGEKDGQVTKAEDEKEDDEVKSSLSKSRIRVGRLAMDGAEERNRSLRALEDSGELEKLDVKEEHQRKRILIKRNEGKLKSPLKRRADRQIYQPPAAKSKEGVSDIKTRLGQKATSDTEKVDEEKKDGKDEKDKEVSVRKRPRITFHTDATSDHTDSENSQKHAKIRLSNMETLGGRTIKSGIVRIKPISESTVTESEHSEPQPSKRKRGGGLRERLLKQSEKFTVGVAGGKLDSTSEKPEATDEMKNVRRLITPAKDGVRDSDRGPTSGRVNVEPAEASIGGRKSEGTDDLRTDLGLAEGEQTVVSSSGSSDMSGGNRGATDKGIRDVGSVDIIPNKRALPFTSEQKSLSPSSSILPDSTNQSIPSAIIGQPNIIVPSQPLGPNTSEPGNMDGKAQKESSGRSSKPRMSVTDDDLDGLLDDVDGSEGPDQYEDDDDALLNELEDLINA